MFKGIQRIIVLFRDAITGRFVSKKYAEENPSTTVKEKRKVLAKPKTKK